MMLQRLNTLPWLGSFSSNFQKRHGSQFTIKWRSTIMNSALAASPQSPWILFQFQRYFPSIHYTIWVHPKGLKTSPCICSLILFVVLWKSLNEFSLCIPNQPTTTTLQGYRSNIHSYITFSLDGCLQKKNFTSLWWQRKIKWRNCMHIHESGI